MSSLFFYNEDNDYRHICHRLKYQGDIRIGRFFSRELGKRLKDSPLFRDGKRTYTLEDTVSRCLSRLPGDRASLLMILSRRLHDVGAVFQALFGRPLPLRSRAEVRAEKYKQTTN